MNPVPVFGKAGRLSFNGSRKGKSKIFKKVNLHLRKGTNEDDGIKRSYIRFRGRKC
jgi:hypothetical protein